MKLFKIEYLNDYPPASLYCVAESHEIAVAKFRLYAEQKQNEWNSEKAKRDRDLEERRKKDPKALDYITPIFISIPGEIVSVTYIETRLLGVS